MPDFRQCRGCSRLFQYYGNPFCPNCQEDMDGYYREVREFIYNNPRASVQEVVEATEVDEKFIIQFLKEGRLSFADAVSALQCEYCGRNIATGRYCEKCTHEMSATLGNVVAEHNEKKAAKKDTFDGGKRSGELHVDFNRKR